MEKTITINEQTIRLKSTIFTHILYKQQFGKDMNSQITRISTLANKLTKLKKSLEEAAKAEGNESEIENLSEQISGIATDVQIGYVRLFWVYARTADKSIPDFDTWVSDTDIDDFTIIMNTVNELAIKSNRIDQKNE